MAIKNQFLFDLNKPSNLKRQNRTKGIYEIVGYGNVIKLVV